MTLLKTGNQSDLVYSRTQYTVYIAARVEIDVFSPKRIKG